MHSIPCFSFCILLALIFSTVDVPTTVGQVTNDQWLKQLELSTETRDRVEAIRALSTSIIRQFVTDAERAMSIKTFKKIATDKDPVVRLAVNVELLKIAAAENDTSLAKEAMKAVDDENINVRRGMVKFFRTFYGGRYEYGKAHEKLLLEQLEDNDLAIRFHAAATLHSWNVSNEKILEIMLDSLDLQNYRAATTYSLVQAKNDRTILTDMIMERLAASEHNAGVYINLLSLLTPESNSKLQKLLPFYKNENVSVRAAVVDAVGRMNTDGDPANRQASIEILVDAIDDPSDVIRRLLLTSLVKLEPGTKLFKDTMFQLLEDENEQVSLAASDAFSFFADNFEQIRPEIESLLAGDSKPNLVATLNGCMTCGPMAKPVAPLIIELLERNDEEIQIRACWALNEIEPDRAATIDALNQLLARGPSDKLNSTALLALSQFEPTNEDSRDLFLANLANPDPDVRVSCCIGLKNYASPELVDKVIHVERENVSRPTGQLTPLDQAVVAFLVATGEEGARKLIPYVSDQNAAVRSRAIAAISQSQIVDSTVRTKILAGLQSDDSMVQFVAADAASRFDKVETETLNRMFEITNPNNRQQTVRILKLFARMGANASPIAPRIATLMNGVYRNRFSNDAKKTILALGKHAATAVPELLKGGLSLSKLDCLAAIGPPANAATEVLRKRIDELSERIKNQRSLREAAMDRRTRIAAAVALWKVSGDLGPVSRIIQEEFQTDARPMALDAIKKIGSADPSLVLDVMALLPDSSAINTLAELGEVAQPATEELKAIASGTDADSAYLASKALWQINNDPGIAVKIVEQILKENRFEAVDIRLEDRQRIWEALRYLAVTSDPEAKRILNEVERGRFPGLRNFVKQLPRS